MNTKENVYENEARIQVEDFLLYSAKAYKRTDIKALMQLYEQFPETAELAFDDDYLDSLSDPADFEYQYRHPILINSNRMTQNRVLDMVAFLFSKHEAPDKYKQILMGRIAYCDVFNYQLERYQRDYDKIALWDHFFMELPEVCYIIEKRHIQSIDELIYRACCYFEKYR